MSKDYCPKKGKYMLPPTVYFHTVSTIRDYYHLKEMAQAILEESTPPSDGMPHGSPSPDGVFNKASRRMYFTLVTDIIDDELMRVPKEFRMGVWDNVVNRKAFPRDADRTTYARYKSKMIFNVATRMGLI